MKIVIDDKIPYIREAISSLTDDAVYLKGAAIRPEDVRDADALIVRTRTPVRRRTSTSLSLPRSRAPA